MMPTPLVEASLGALVSVAQFGLNWILQSLVLAAIGLAIATVARRFGAATQSAIYRTTLVAILVAPVATALLCSCGVAGWSIRLPLAAEEPPAVIAVEKPLAPATVDEVTLRQSGEFPQPGFLPPEFDRFGGMRAFSPEPESQAATPGAASLAKPLAANSADTKLETTHHWSRVAAAALASLWLAGIALALARLARAWVSLEKLCRAALPVDGETRALCARLAHTFGIPMPNVRRSPWISSPCVVGIFRSTILVCEDATPATPPLCKGGPGGSRGTNVRATAESLARFPPPPALAPNSQRNADLTRILTHELAHIARHDVFWNLLRYLATSCLFMQPFIWRLARALEATAEEICDDYVVRLGADRVRYAEQLYELAVLTLPATAATAVGIKTRRTALTDRVQRILDTSRQLSTSVSVRRYTAIVLAGTLLTTLAGLLGADSSPEARLSHQAGSPHAIDSPSLDTRDKEPNPEHPLAAGTQFTLDAQDEEQPAARPALPPLAKGRSETDATTAIAALHRHKYSGRVTDVGGKPIAAATISLVFTKWGDTTVSAVHELARSDENGGFRFELKAEIAEELRRLVGDNPKLVAQAPQHGLDWLPLDAFDEITVASNDRALQRALVDKALGAGRFAGRTLKLPPQDKPVRGRIVDLEGRPLQRVAILVEDISRPDIPMLTKAFRQSSKELVVAANNATFYPWVEIERSALQQFFPSVTTNANGEFTLEGIGRDQLATVSLHGERIEARRLHILGRTMEMVRLPHLPAYPNGAKDTYAGYEFTFAVGSSVPVRGVVRDHDTNRPIPGTIVYVERLFGEGGGAAEGQVRLDCRQMRTVTDEKGEFRIAGLPPGQGHELEAIPPRTEPWLMAAQRVSPSATERETLVEIRVKRAMWIEGRVTDKATGKPLDARVEYLALQKNPHTLDKIGLRQAWEVARYHTDKDGRYRVPGLPGPGVVLVRAREKADFPLAVGADKVDGYEPNYLPTTPAGLPLSSWHLIRQIEPAADDSTFNCDLVLDAGQSVHGRVVTADGRLVSDFEAFGEVVNEAFWAPRTNGTFIVGAYDGRGPRQLFFKSRDEALAGQFRLEGEPPPEIIVTLQPSVRVTGRLIAFETNEPAAGYELYSDTSSLGAFRIAGIITDHEGRFEIKGMVPGVVYDMHPSYGHHFKDRDRFKIDLTAAKPGDVVDLGDLQPQSLRNAAKKKKSPPLDAKAAQVSPTQNSDAQETGSANDKKQAAMKDGVQE